MDSRNCLYRRGENRQVKQIIKIGVAIAYTKNKQGEKILNIDSGFCLY